MSSSWFEAALARAAAQRNADVFFCAQHTMLSKATPAQLALVSEWLERFKFVRFDGYDKTELLIALVQLWFLPRMIKLPADIAREPIIRLALRNYNKTIGGAAFSQQIGDLAWSPDGRVIATATLAGVRLWDADTGEARALIDADAHAVCWLDAQRLLIGHSDGRLTVHDADQAGGRVQQHAVVPAPAREANEDGIIYVNPAGVHRLQPRGALVAVSRRSRTVQMYSTANWQTAAAPLWSVDGILTQFALFCWVDDERVAYVHRRVETGEEEIVIANAATGEARESHVVQTTDAAGSIRALFALNGKVNYVVEDSVYSLETDAAVEVPLTSWLIRRVAVSGARVAFDLGHGSGLWSGERTAVLDAGKWTTSVAWSPNGERLAWGVLENRNWAMRIWGIADDLSVAQPPAIDPPFAGPIDERSLTTPVRRH